MQDLFDHAAEEERAAQAPLAARMRPRSLKEFLGQAHIVGEKAPLGAALRNDRLWSVILWGPPGTGKTTLATIAARLTKSRFIALSAVTCGVKDIRAAVAEAREETRLYRRRTLLFIDEMHRFNRGQQDALLPHVEDGTVILWGATTENPYFDMIGPLLSRVRVLQLQPLGETELRAIVTRALSDEERGLAGDGLRLAEAAMDFVAERADGDARVGLNWLEAAAELARAEGLQEIAVETLERAMLQRQVRYDRAADHHYDTISAFIKSIRGSDPDGAIFWLAKMVEAGEAPEFIARRLLISASEDIGNAAPGALSLALAAYQAVERLGLPEATYPLAQATLYLASAPKSNSAGSALSAAREAIRQGADVTVPLHLRNAAFSAAAEMGHGKGYKYAHSFPGHFVEQDHLPDAEQHRRFYRPADTGAEVEAARRLREWWGERYAEESEAGE